MNPIQKMMFTVHRSDLDFEETIAALTRSAEAQGWEIPMVYDLQEGYQQAGYQDMSRIKILYFCNPQGGYRILQDDRNKPMSVMMPMGVSVYETNESQVYIAGMNLERMSMIFGGTVKEVLQDGATKYAQTLRSIANPTEEPTDVGLNRGRCCLGCISVTAILGLLAAGLVLLVVKVMPLIMPKMMARMMPKMRAAMREAGVQPPCAQIILEHLETQDRTIHGDESA